MIGAGRTEGRAVALSVWTGVVGAWRESPWKNVPETGTESSLLREGAESFFSLRWGLRASSR
jgi:hypothetical protein